MPYGQTVGSCFHLPLDSLLLPLGSFPCSDISLLPDATLEESVLFTLRAAHTFIAGGCKW